jgi:hypothetical protein
VKQFLENEIIELYAKELSLQNEKYEFENQLRENWNEKNEILTKEKNLEVCYQELGEENLTNKLRLQKLLEESREVREELERLREEMRRLEEEMERQVNENVEMMNEKDLLEQSMEVMRCERDELVRQFIPGGYYQRDEYGVEILYTR